MRIKEYEQKLIQDLARRKEECQRKIKYEKVKEVFIDLCARENEINRIFAEIMGIRIIEKISGSIMYLKRRILKHTRNVRKRR